MNNININKIYKYINPFKENNILKIDKQEINKYLLSNNIYSNDTIENKDNLYKKITYLIANPNILEQSYISIKIPSNENEFNSLFDKYSDNYAIYIAHLLSNKDSINVDFNGNSNDLKSVFNIKSNENLLFSKDVFKINNTLNLNYIEELNSINFWSTLDYCLQNISKDNFIITWPLISSDIKEEGSFIDKIIPFVSLKSSSEKDLDEEAIYKKIINHYKYYVYDDGTLFIDKLFKNSSPSFFSFILFEFYANDLIDVFENNKKINNFDKIYNFFNQSKNLLEFLKQSDSEKDFNEKLTWNNELFDIRQLKKYLKFENLSSIKYPSDDFYTWFEHNSQSYSSDVGSLGYNPYINDGEFTELFNSKFSTIQDKLNLVNFCSHLFIKKNNHNETFMNQFLKILSDISDKDLFEHLSISTLSDPEKSFCIRNYYKFNHKKCEHPDYIQFIINQAKYAVSVLDITTLSLSDLEKVISHNINFKLINNINPDYIKSVNSPILNNAFIKQNSFSNFLNLMGEDILYDTSNPNYDSFINEYISINSKLKPEIMDLICNDIKLFEHIIEKIEKYNLPKLKFTIDQINKPFIAEKYVAKLINTQNFKTPSELIDYLSYNKEYLQNYNKINLNKFSNLESIENLIVFTKGKYIKFLNENSFNDKNTLLMISRVLDNVNIEADKILPMLPSKINNLFNSYSIKINYHDFISKLIFNNDLDNSLNLNIKSNIKKNKI